MAAEIPVVIEAANSPWTVATSAHAHYRLHHVGVACTQEQKALHSHRRPWVAVAADSPWTAVGCTGRRAVVDGEQHSPMQILPHSPCFPLEAVEDSLWTVAGCTCPQVEPGEPHSLRQRSSHSHGPLFWVADSWVAAGSHERADASAPGGQAEAAGPAGCWGGDTQADPLPHHQG